MSPRSTIRFSTHPNMDNYGKVVGEVDVHVYKTIAQIVGIELDDTEYVFEPDVAVQIAEALIEAARCCGLDADALWKAVGR